MCCLAIVAYVYAGSDILAVALYGEASMALKASNGGVARRSIMAA